jgi:hydroxypyruvate isomerase
MINISDNPNFDFKRKVDNDEVLIVIDCKNKYVILQLDVYNYTQEGELIIDIPVKTVPLTADNIVRVDVNGIPTNVVADQVMGEYDYFKIMMGNPVRFDN